MTVPYKAARFAVIVFAALACADAADALTLTNRDEQDHKVTVIEGEKKTDFVVKPSESLADVCPKGCVIRLDDIADEDQDYELEGTETVSIEDGFLYYESPEPTGPSAAPAAPAPAAPATTPAAPATPPQQPAPAPKK